MNKLYNFDVEQRLLIKPFERVRFVVFFILATILIKFVVGFLFSRPAFVTINNEVQFAIVTGIIGGTLMGFFQWLVLRKFIRDWKWILVVALSAAFTSSIAALQNAAIERMLQNYDTSAIGQADLYSLLTLISVFCSGYLEWFVLRPYIVKGRWWIFLRFIAIILVLIPIAITSLIGITFNKLVLSLTLLPSVQAIAFCLLHKKKSNYVSRESLSESTDNLSLAPEIDNYWQII